MFNIVFSVFKLLSYHKKRKLLLLQFLVIFSSFSQLVSIASIAPFMALVANYKLLKEDNILSYVYNLTGLSEHAFLIFIGGSVLFVLLFSTAVSIITTWKLSVYSFSVSEEFSNNLFSYYLRRDWLFHSSKNSAQLTKKIANETQRVNVNMIKPILTINSNLVLMLFILVALTIYDPFVALAGFLVFFLLYLFIYMFIKKKLYRNGVDLSLMATERFKLMNEGFGGIRDVLLLGCDRDFISRFENANKVFSSSQSYNQTVADAPKFFMQLIAYSSMIILVLYLLFKHDSDLTQVLPIVSVYALSAMKLLPTFQSIYNSIAKIKGAIPAFESIKNDLYLASKERILFDKNKLKDFENNKVSFFQQVTFSNVSFRYPGKPRNVLNNINLIIPKNTVVGVVGASGSGKSTLIDVFTGIIPVEEGQVYIDDIALDKTNLRSWQDLIGFVPQSIFLTEGSIAENIAFGLPVSEIDYQRVNKALELAHLSELISGYNEGVNTKVGERGVQLSGGQRQRIGIARALYYDAEVLVFDEATSALDGITEKVIMDAIHDFMGTKTIIMIAHRIQTIEKCDSIILMEKGRIVDQGNYSELLSRNESFRMMAENA